MKFFAKIGIGNQFSQLKTDTSLFQYHDDPYFIRNNSQDMEWLNEGLVMNEKYELYS